MTHIVEGWQASHLQKRPAVAAAGALAMHTFILAIVILMTQSVHQRGTIEKSHAPAAPSFENLVFVFRESATPPGGGGGGGNGQSAPIRHAEAPGLDPATLHIALSADEQERQDAASVLPALVLDAKPLESGIEVQAGLPIGGVSIGTSLGNGSAGGVGDGVGSGIGPGRGPGLGDGSDGGAGVGPYRAGGSVTPPRVIVQVKPAYTNRAMMARLEGSVLLELVVQANGMSTNIRVTRSLDPDGLDRETVRAASQWRFAPGRLNGPVDVLASIQIDFHVR